MHGQINMARALERKDPLIRSLARKGCMKEACAELGARVEAVTAAVRFLVAVQRGVSAGPSEGEGTDPRLSQQLSVGCGRSRWTRLGGLETHPLVLPPTPLGPAGLHLCLHPACPPQRWRGLGAAALACPLPLADGAQTPVALWPPAVLTPGARWTVAWAGLGLVRFPEEPPGPAWEPHVCSTGSLRERRAAPSRLS